jgi:hypothetical protein
MDIDVKELEPGWDIKLKKERHFPDSVILEIKKLIIDEYDEELLRLRNRRSTVEPEQFKNCDTFKDRCEYEHAYQKEHANHEKIEEEVQWRTKHYASLLNIPESQWFRDFTMARSRSKSVRGDFDKEGNRIYRKKKLSKPKPKRKVCRCKK